VSVLWVTFVHVGEGDTSLLVLPNGKRVMVDCCLKEDKVWEAVVSQLPKGSGGKRVLDCLILTHPHSDHIGGIGRLAEEVIVKEIWESGHRLYVPKDEQEDYPDYYDMLKLFQKVKARGGSVRVLRANRGGFVGGLDDSVRWYCLSPSRAYAEEDRPTESQIHEQCLVLKVEFAGNSVLFTGDTTWRAWSERIVPDYPDLLPATILHGSHHGSRTFFMDSPDDEAYTEHVKRISPDITIIPVGLNSHGHPHQEALDVYEEHTFRRSATQVMRTDRIGTICAKFRDNGSYRIMPRRHLRARHGKFLGCRAWVVPNPPPDRDGTYPRKVEIEFQVHIKKLRNVEVGKIRFEVQNNGVGPDRRVHDWYLGQDEATRTYSNRTAFAGSHNLYVKVKSKKGKLLCEFVHTVKVRDEN